MKKITPESFYLPLLMHQNDSDAFENASAIETFYTRKKKKFLIFFFQKNFPCKKKG
jgi:hypothetical protein